MVSSTEDFAAVPRSPSLARDAVACLVLFVVGNVYAAIVWEQHLERPASRRLSVSTYAATPLAADNTLDGAAGICDERPTVIPEAAPQLGDGPGTSGLPTPSSIVTHHACPNDMRLVDGLHCPLPAQECLDYLSVERDRCRQYVANSPCIGNPMALRYCIDEFEFPNQAGTKPMVWVSYLQAVELCAKGNKRLCTTSEWELACEGPERLPYATGYRRDSERCNFDRPNIVADHDALANPNTRDAEFARVDQREPSGARPKCVSYYGVFDMTGNVDEWVQNEHGFVEKAPYHSALKGGYWGRVRNRCRPTTTDHNEWHSGYQVGFRCCAEATSAVATNR